MPAAVPPGKARPAASASRPSIPRVIPSSRSRGRAPRGRRPGPRVINSGRDTPGWSPAVRPGRPRGGANAEVAKDVADLIELVQEPEAEIAVVVGSRRSSRPGGRSPGS